MTEAESVFADAVVAAIGGRSVGLFAAGPAAAEAMAHWAARGVGRAGDGDVVIALLDGEEPMLPDNTVAAVRSRGSDPTGRLESLRRVGDLVADRLPPDHEARP